MRIYSSLLAALWILSSVGYAQTRAGGDQISGGDAVRMAAIVMNTWKEDDESKAPRWIYEEGVVWKGLESCWYNTGDARYYKYIQHFMDRLVDKEGCILYGKQLLLLYKVSNQEKYYKAAQLLRHQLQEQPHTAEGLYMAQPFYAEWAATFHEDSAFNDIARQLVQAERPTRDIKTVRVMGWYGMALVDVLDYFPVNHPGRKQLLAILNRYAAAVAKVQDPDVSASCMFVYALEKGVRMGWLPMSYRAVAKKGYAGVLGKGTDAISRLGGEAIGVFLLAAGEMEQLPTLRLGKNRTVLLDYYFNNEHKKDITGTNVRYHYTWEDQANSGFSFWGSVFRRHGLHTDSLAVAPTAERLRKAAVYIIVDPDNEKESPAPNYPSPTDIQAIYDWVRAGGVLLLMSNDSANAEFLHFNKLASTFGIHFNLDDRNKVMGDNYEQGAFIMTGQDGIFKTTHKVYIKELSTLRLSEPARARYSVPKIGDGGDKTPDVIMATARIGKGTVFAVGDPWFYNEYLDGRKLPAEYENFNAANDLVKWIIAEINTL